MSIPPTIPPPPDDQYENSPRSRMAGFINGITGGGNARLNEIMAEDHARKMADLEMHRNSAHQYSQVLLSGISPQTGKALTDDEKTRYTLMQEQAQKQYEKVAGINPEAKDILGKLGTVVKHVMGKKGGGGGQGGQGGTPAGGAGGPAIPGPPGSTGAASAAPVSASATPPAPPVGSTPPFIPPGTASASPAKQGPELAQAGTPPPTSAAAPPSSMPPPALSPLAVSQGAPIVGAQLGQQMELAKAKQSEQQQADIALATKQKGELAAPAITQQQLEAIRKMPQEDRFPAMMHMGIIPPMMMHPTKVVVPDDPANPSAGAHVEFISPMQMMMEGEGQGPAAFVPSGQMGTQKTTSSNYNPDTGTTSTVATTRKVAGGRMAGPGVAGAGSASKSGVASAGAAPKSGGRIASMAKDYADYGKVPSAKDSPAVEKYMSDQGLTPGVKPTVQEINLADSVRKAEPKLQELTDFIEKNNLTGKGEGGLLSLSAWTERGKVQKAWEEYSHGLPPKDKQLGQLIKYAAALKVMGAAPWMSMSRGKYMYQEVAQHLPSTTDTPAQLYEKAQFFKSILDDTKGSLPQQLLKPRVAIPPPSGGGKGKGAGNVPAGVIHWGRDAQGNPVQLSQ